MRAVVLLMESLLKRCAAEGVSITNDVGRYVTESFPVNATVFETMHMQLRIETHLVRKIEHGVMALEQIFISHFYIEDMGLAPMHHGDCPHELIRLLLDRGAFHNRRSLSDIKNIVDVVFVATMNPGVLLVSLF